MRYLLPFITVFLFNTVYSQGFKKTVDSCYNFNPHELNDEEIQKKSRVLDVFFRKVESDTSYYIPLLRKELIAEGHKPFFYFDGATLLLKHIQSDKDYEIVYKAMLRTDIRDIQEQDYLIRANLLANKGFNTLKFAEEVLKSKAFKPYIAQHGLHLDKDYSLVFILLPLNPDIYTNRIAEILSKDKTLQNQLAVITVLGYSCTCKADSIIKVFANKKGVKKAILERIKTFNIGLGQSDIQEYNNLIEKRKNLALSKVSDESLFILDDITKKLKAKYSCNKN